METESRLGAQLRSDIQERDREIYWRLGRVERSAKLAWALASAAAAALGFLAVHASNIPERIDYRVSASIGVGLRELEQAHQALEVRLATLSAAVIAGDGSRVSALAVSMAESGLRSRVDVAELRARVDGLSLLLAAMKVLLEGDETSARSRRAIDHIDAWTRFQDSLDRIRGAATNVAWAPTEEAGADRIDRWRQRTTKELERISELYRECVEEFRSQLSRLER